MRLHFYIDYIDVHAEKSSLLKRKGREDNTTYFPEKNKYQWYIHKRKINGHNLKRLQETTKKKHAKKCRTMRAAKKKKAIFQKSLIRGTDHITP